MQVQSLGLKIPWKRKMAIPLQHSCLENPWAEETGGPHFMGLQRVRHGTGPKHKSRWWHRGQNGVGSQGTAGWREGEGFYDERKWQDSDMMLEKPPGFVGRWGRCPWGISGDVLRLLLKAAQSWRLGHELRGHRKDRKGVMKRPTGARPLAPSVIGAHFDPHTPSLKSV